jgi:hypothetical protein
MFIDLPAVVFNLLRGSFSKFFYHFKARRDERHKAAIAYAGVAAVFVR